MSQIKMKLDCEHCPVKQYCGTMVSSIRLCRSIHKNKDNENNNTKG